MTRILFVLLFTGTSTITAFSQTQNQPEIAPTCNLSLSQAPAIRGIRLGMKPDEWLKLFPGSAQDERLKAILDQPPQYPEYGLSRITFESPSSRTRHGGAFRYLSKEEFSGVDRVSLTLFDNQITDFRVEYAQPVGVDPWEDISQLIDVFSEAFRLPKGFAWGKMAGSKRAVLQCSGFELDLSTSGSSTEATLKSKSDYIQTIRQRAAADRQKHRAAFKP